jgi:hypothetical protein
VTPSGLGDDYSATEHLLAGAGSWPGAGLLAPSPAGGGVPAPAMFGTPGVNGGAASAFVTPAGRGGPAASAARGARAHAGAPTPLPLNLDAMFGSQQGAGGGGGDAWGVE